MPMSPETRAKISAAKKANPTRYWLGKKRPDMTGEKHFLYGKKMPKEWAENARKGREGKLPVGEKNCKWKGDQVSYRNLHRWVERHLGKPSNCSSCGIAGTGRQIHWANKSGNYLRDTGDWLRLCASCHGAYDSRNNLRRNLYQAKLATITT